MDSATPEWTPDAGQPPGDGDALGPRRRRRGAWPAVLLLAGVSAVAGCRIADVDGVTPVPQLLAFWPWLAVPTVVALGFATLARRRASLVWGLLVLGTIAWFTEPYGRASQPQGTPLAAVRVLTSNVERGRATRDLMGVVRRERPDVVFVEECDHRCSATLDAEFGDGAYPYRSAAGGGGSAGSLILSRYPLQQKPAVRGTLGMPGAVADVRGHAVRLQLAHPMPPEPGGLDAWHAELGALRVFADGVGSEPTVLAGDFNASQDHAGFRRILDTGLHDAARLSGASREPSWPARTTPALGAQIDHVLVSGEFSADHARFLRLTGTDHRALLVELTLHDAADGGR